MWQPRRRLVHQPDQVGQAVELRPSQSALVHLALDVQDCRAGCRLGPQDVRAVRVRVNRKVQNLLEIVERLLRHPFELG